jgi:hypothetical protein
MPPGSAERQLHEFISKYTPAIQKIATETLEKMRVRLPGAIELVYDNYNALAIGFGPTERASEILFSIALYPRWVTLFVMDGVHLPDPDGILKGSGKGVRHVVLEDASTLDKPAVRTIMKLALQRAPQKLRPEVPNRIVIKSVSAKQRPRRPSAQS